VGTARWPSLLLCLAVLRLRQAIVWWQVAFVLVCVHRGNGLWFEICMHGLRAVRFVMDLNARLIRMGMFVLDVILCRDTSRKVHMFCAHT